MAATVYFCGGEDTSFTFVGATVVMQTTVNTFRSGGWARGALSVSVGSTTDPPSPRMTGRQFINKSNALVTPSSLWAHFWQIWGASGGACTSNATLFRLLDSSGVARLMVRGAGSGALKISKRDAAATITDLITSANAVLPVGGLNQNVIDFKVDYAEVITTSGRTDVTFSGATPGVITIPGFDLVAAGFTNGGTVVITGTTGGTNNGTYLLAASGGVTTHTLTLASGAFPGGAQAAGPSVTITSTGTARLWVNQGVSPVAYVAGGISTDGVTALAQMDIANCDTGHITYISEVIVADQDTRGKGLWTISPVAAGGTQQWLPNTVGNINEAVINDTTFVSTGGNNQISNWTTSQTAPTGGWIVDAVVQEARLEVGVTGPQHAEFTAVVGGTIAAAGTVAPTTSFTNFTYTWAQNPITVSDWALTDITIGTFNLGVESLA